MKRSICGAVIAIALTGAAHGQWMTTVEDDLFSDDQVVTMIGVGSDSWSIYATCQGSEASLAYIERADPGQLASSVPAGTIVIKADVGERWESDASIYPHNDSFVGFSFDDTTKLRQVIEDIGKAKSKITVGLDLILSDSPSQASLSAQGSSRAARDFLAACDFE